VLTEIQIEHASLGRGGRANGVARLSAPSGSTGVILEATASTRGDTWQVEVADPSWVRAGFWVRCRADRPSGELRWTFTLRDARGRRSNSLVRAVECTAEALPGTAPRLESVTLDDPKIVVGWGTVGHARFAGTHPPLQLFARSDTPGYGWQWGLSATNPSHRELSFRCLLGRPPHTVRWRFSVRDTYGRESNVIETTMACGECRRAP
jgi:hypothetical protein